MKKNFYLALTLVVMIGFRASAADTNTNEWGAVTNGIQMSIGLKGDNQKLKTNQPVVLLICYKNVSSNETIVISNQKALSLDATYSFVVISPSGKDVSPNLPKSFAGSGEIYPVGPNQTKEFEVNLSQLCNFDEVGTYTIISKKLIIQFEHPKQKWFVVVSNPLNIVIN